VPRASKWMVHRWDRPTPFALAAAIIKYGGRTKAIES